jgi:hypothetical protein
MPNWNLSMQRVLEVLQRFWNKLWGFREQLARTWARLQKQLDNQDKDKAWTTEVKYPSELDQLRKNLLKLLYGDEDACKRLVQGEQKRNPHKLEIDLYRDVIERLERDRGR